MSGRISKSTSRNRKSNKDNKDTSKPERVAGFFNIKNTTKNKIPNLPFLEIKNKILGENYELSLVFISSQKIKTLNKNYRGKNKPTDILSFPLDKQSGEIFISLKEANKKSKLHNQTEKNYLGFLFIHGLLHLKGLDHGSRMEAKEKTFCSFFGIKNI